MSDLLKTLISILILYWVIKSLLYKLSYFTVELNRFPMCLPTILQRLHKHSQKTFLIVNLVIRLIVIRKGSHSPVIDKTTDGFISFFHSPLV